MLPIYIGVDGEENQGLCSGGENYWCVSITRLPRMPMQATRGLHVLVRHL